MYPIYREKCSINAPCLYVRERLNRVELSRLDNSYVYHTLVKQLADVKEKRQLIVATHSPNIAVAGNAENILVLKGNGENGWIECNGTIHNNRVSNEAVDILEGNETVFKERAELYGII